ncbi:hypothetical protein Syun_020630 [Stephania yunnanensis]|uniref:Uncharacterized protein n=1 Tax=Stephania yunnanensis TaxID=152371 RepID=A0AAP0IE94_9MAGN
MLFLVFAKDVKMLHGEGDFWFKRRRVVFVESCRFAWYVQWLPFSSFSTLLYILPVGVYIITIPKMTKRK